MIEWQDEGIILSARAHGESGKIVTILTSEHGLARGFLPGGQSKSKAALLQIGTLVNAHWQGRVEEQLGRYMLEAIYQPHAFILQSRLALEAMASACALTEFAVVERIQLKNFYDAFKLLLESLSEDYWPFLYLKWELCLLESLGFGLDLTKCAVTGANENLVAVSPKTGRAVSSIVAAPYGNKLLPLPSFLLNTKVHPSWKDILEALQLTGYFLEKHVFHVQNKPLPETRARLMELFQKKVEEDAA